MSSCSLANEAEMLPKPPGDLAGRISLQAARALLSGHLATPVNAKSTVHVFKAVFANKPIANGAKKPQRACTL